MAVIKHPTKDGWWILDIRNGKKGPRDRIPFEGTWDEAMAEYLAIKQRSARVVTSKNRIADLLPDFIREYRLEKSPETIRDFLVSWKRLGPHFGHLHFHSLTIDDITSYKEKRLRDTWCPARQSPDPEVVKRNTRPVTRRTISKELSYFSSFQKWAVTKGYCLALPFQIKGFKKKHTKPRAPVVLYGDEFDLIIKEMREPQRTMVIIMHDAGLRKKECYNLTREQVDLDREIITVIGKGNKERLVPIIGDRLAGALQSIIDIVPRGHLFINPRTKEPYKDISDSFKTAAGKANVNKRIYNHLFRHCFGTGMAHAGVHPVAMKDALGHETFATTNMYIHTAAEFLRSELSKMDPGNGGQKTGEKQ